MCFTCGQVARADAAPNRLPSGDACPACLDRFTDSLPALLPRLPQAPRARRRITRHATLRVVRSDSEPRTGSEPARPA